jgi:WD40 repeat protein
MASGVWAEEQEKKAAPAEATLPWVTSLSIDPGSGKILTSVATSLPYRAGSLHHSTLPSIDKLEPWAELATAGWAVLLVDQGKKLVASDYAGNVYTADLQDPKSLKKLEPKQKWIRALADAGDGKVWVGTEEGKLVPLQVQEGTFGTAIEAHKAGIFSIQATPDRKSWITTAGDGSVKLWNASDMALVREFQFGNQAVWAAALDTSGKYLLTADAARRVNMFAVESGAILLTLGMLSDWGTSLVVLDAHTIAVGSLDGHVYFLDLVGKRVAAKVQAAKSGIWTLHPNNGTKQLIAGTRSHGLQRLTSDQWESAVNQSRSEAAAEVPPGP